MSEIPVVPSKFKISEVIERELSPDGSLTLDRGKAGALLRWLAHSERSLELNEKYADELFRVLRLIDSYNEERTNDKE